MLEVLRRFIIAILALKALTEIKKWKIVKPLFTEKMNTNEEIVLVDNNNIISPEIQIAQKLF